ncbi:hypothetical protein GC175_33545 [bacterium]|nr:hypothetical protein [bacterium]
MSTLKRLFVIALAVVILSVAGATPSLAQDSTPGRPPTLNVCWIGNTSYPLNFVFWWPAPYGYDLYICKIDGWHYYMPWGYPGKP